MAALPRKILIYGRNFHARAAFRKLEESPEAWHVMGFVEKSAGHPAKEFLGKRIFTPAELSLIDFDSIVIAGRYTNEMRTAILQSGVASAKIWEMKRSEYQPTETAMHQRSEQTYATLKDLLCILKNQGLEHWFVASSLLALKRNQDLAWFADVDIAVPYEKLEDLHSALQVSGLFHSVDALRHAANGAFWKEGKVFQITIQSTSILQFSEPAIIDIHALHILDNKAFYNLTDTSFLTVDSAHFMGHQTLRYGDLELNVPVDGERYLQATYGENWQVPAELFNANDHVGRVNW